MIDRIEIDCDEDGFHLIVEGDLAEELFRVMGGKRLSVASPARLNLRLGQDAALQLREQVREKIDPWWAEAEGVRADFERHKRTGQLPPYVRDLDDAVERDEPERLRDAADLARKRRRES